MINAKRDLVIIIAYGQIIDWRNVDNPSMANRTIGAKLLYYSHKYYRQSPGSCCLRSRSIYEQSYAEFGQLSLSQE